MQKIKDFKCTLKLDIKCCFYGRNMKVLSISTVNRTINTNSFLQVKQKYIVFRMGK